MRFTRNRFVFIFRSTRGSRKENSCCRKRWLPPGPLVVHLIISFMVLYLASPSLLGIKVNIADMLPDPHVTKDAFQIIYLFFWIVQVWAGPLSGQRLVVALWNRCSQAESINVDLDMLGIESSISVSVRDLWKVRNLTFSMRRQGLLAILASWTGFTKLIMAFWYKTLESWVIMCLVSTTYPYLRLMPLVNSWKLFCCVWLEWK